jgi:Mg2+/citrate symporter
MLLFLNGFLILGAFLYMVFTKDFRQLIPLSIIAILFIIIYNETIINLKFNIIEDIEPDCSFKY